MRCASANEGRRLQREPSGVRTGTQAPRHFDRSVDAVPRDHACAENRYLDGNEPFASIGLEREDTSSCPSAVPHGRGAPVSPPETPCPCSPADGVGAAGCPTTSTSPPRLPPPPADPRRRPSCSSRARATVRSVSYRLDTPPPPPVARRRQQLVSAVRLECLHHGTDDAPAVRLRSRTETQRRR